MNTKDASLNDFEIVVGLEIHVELATKSKMFCQCQAEWFEMKPNSNVCPVCLGLPGALPVPNEKAIESCVKLALALGCDINLNSKFDRKHYFYPDLPKGYQISQYDLPFGKNGNLEIVTDISKNEKKLFGITRVHMEEDTGKLNHFENYSEVDFNRSGVPLVEIVTEPDFRSSSDVKLFLEELRAIIVSLGISGADMEKGSMRLEPNISVRRVGEKKLPGYKVEVKNINSFRYVKQAIDFEFARHMQLLLNGEVPAQETRGWNEKKNVTFSQRTKEGAADYRYFPEPDIPPIVISTDYIEKISASILALPMNKYENYLKEFKIKTTDAYILSHDISLSDVFEKLVSHSSVISPQAIANFLINKKPDLNLGVANLFDLIAKTNTIVSFDENELIEIVNIVISENPGTVTTYRNGKESVIMYLVGLVMQSHKGKFPATKVKEELERQLKNSA